MSNRASGRALLIAIALLVVAGCLLLWFQGPGRSTDRVPSPTGQDAPPAPRNAPAELTRADPPPDDGPLAPERGELDPFASARDLPAHPTGPGSLRGHVSVAGEQSFPTAWTLVLGPSLYLPTRENAIEQRLAFADGRAEFEVKELPLGGYDVHAEADGFNGQVLSVLLEAGNEHPFLELRLVPAGELEGRVLDAAERPAEGVTITLFAAENQAERTAPTDVAGLYRFTALPDGAYELMVGRATAPLMPERHPVRFMAPHLTFPDIELPLLGEIRVRVVDSLERPIEGVEVRGSGTNGGIVEGKTDYNGVLVARYLPAGHFRIRLEHPAMDAKYARRFAVEVVAGQVADAPVHFGP